MKASENNFPNFVENLLQLNKYDGHANQEEGSEETIDPLENLSSINQCLDKDSLRQLDRKLVRFDCQVVDMYEEDFYIPLLSKK